MSVETTTGPSPTARDSRLLRAARGAEVDRVPVWFMRQAGRSLPEYRALREGTSMLDACSDPAMIHEITMQPVRRHGVDAAIFFSDIVLPLKAVGVDVEIVPGTGPVIAQPVREMGDVERIGRLDPADVAYVSAAVRSLVDELGETPLIGFAGAPYTLASYLVEGGPSKDHAATKALMLGRPDVWDTLLRRLADVSATFLRVQVEAGASAVQLFDSWAGGLAPVDYRSGALPYARQVFDAVADLGVPRIHFGVGTGEILPDMASAGIEVIGVDWRVPLDEAVRRTGGRLPVQGNLDPALLGAPWDVLAARVDDVLDRGAAAPGHVFNLGHGVPPSCDPDALTRIVEHVHTREVPARHA